MNVVERSISITTGSVVSSVVFTRAGSPFDISGTLVLTSQEVIERMLTIPKLCPDKACCSSLGINS